MLYHKPKQLGCFVFMITDFSTLLRYCDDELYTVKDITVKTKNSWDSLSEWMGKNNYTEFNQEIGYTYCNEVFGSHLRQVDMDVKNREKLRTIRILMVWIITSYFSKKRLLPIVLALVTLYLVIIIHW